MTEQQYDIIIANVMGEMHQLKPIIISNENEIYFEFAEKIAEYCKDLFGDKVILRISFFKWLFNKNYRRLKWMSPKRPLPCEDKVRAILTNNADKFNASINIYKEIYEKYYA